MTRSFSIPKRLVREAFQRVKANGGASGVEAESIADFEPETVIGLYKTEVIHRRGPWRNLEAGEYATLAWVDWFNNRRSLEPIGNIPPAELEVVVLSVHESAADGT